MFEFLKFTKIFPYIYLLVLILFMLVLILIPITIILYLIYFLAKAYFTKKYKPRKFNFEKSFYILGHRGIPGLEHENTLESFELINKFDIDGTEFDVNISHDNKLYVYHDYKLYRFFGIDSDIKNLSSNEIEYLTITLFNSKKSENNILKSKIPTLEQAFEKLKNCRLLNLEIKSNSIKNLGLEEKVAKLIKDFGLENKIVISSFDPFCLYRFSKCLPEIPRGLLVSKTGLSVYLRDMWFLAFSKADFIHFEASYIGTEIVKKMKDKGYGIVYWGVNSIQVFERALKDEPIFVISDIPHIIKSYHKT